MSYIYTMIGLATSTREEKQLDREEKN